MSTMVTSAGAEVLVLDASEGKSLDDLYAEMHELMNRKAQLMDQLNQAALQEDEKEQERVIADLTKLGTATRQVTEEINTAIAAQEPEAADGAGPSMAAQVPEGPGPGRPRETQAQQAMRRDMGSAGVVIYKTKEPKDKNIARAPETPTHGREDTLNGGIANFKVATDLGKKAWTDQTQLARRKAEKYSSGVVDARKHVPVLDKNELATMPDTPAYGDAGLNGGIANLKVANDLARKAWQDTKQGRAAAKNYDNMKVNVYNGPEPKVDMSGIALYQGPETPAGKEDGRFNGGIANMAVAKDLRVANWSEKEWKQAASADGPSGHVNVYERKNGAADPDLKYIMRDPKFGPQGSESRNDDLAEAKTPTKAPGRFNGGLGKFAVASDLAWAMWDNKDVKKRQARLGNQNVEIKSKDEILQLEAPKEPVITEMELGANGGQLYLEMKPHEEAETPKKGKQERFNGGMNNFRVANDLAVIDHSVQEPDEEQEKEDKKRNPDGRVIVYQLTKYKAAPEPENKSETASSVVYRHKMNMPRLPSVDEGSELPKLTYFPHNQPGTVPPSTASNVPLLQYASSVSGTVQPYVRAGVPMLQYHAAGPQTPSAMSLQSSMQLVQQQPMMPAMLPAPQMVPATPMVPQTPSVPASPMVGNGMQLVPVTQQVPAMAMQAVPQQQLVYSMPVQHPMMIPSTPATPATPATMHSTMLPMQPQLVYQQVPVQQQGAQVMQMPQM